MKPSSIIFTSNHLKSRHFCYFTGIHNRNVCQHLQPLPPESSCNHTCDLGNVRDGQPLCVVSRSCQTLCDVARLEIQMFVLLVQRFRKSGRKQEWSQIQLSDFTSLNSSASKFRRMKCPDEIHDAEAPKAKFSSCSSWIFDCWECFNEELWDQRWSLIIS